MAINQSIDEDGGEISAEGMVEDLSEKGKEKEKEIEQVHEPEPEHEQGQQTQETSDGTSGRFIC